MPPNQPDLRYTLIPRTLIFITNTHNELLLLPRKPNNPTWPNLYNAIGGHIEPNETIEEAARREIQEETGITSLETMQLRGIVTITTGTNPGVLLFIFAAHTDATQLTSSPEGIPEWHPLSSLTTLPLVPDIPHLLKKSLPNNPSEALNIFYGHYETNLDTVLHLRFS